jgi:hypothetical protein
MFLFDRTDGYEISASIGTTTIERADVADGTYRPKAPVWLSVVRQTIGDVILR